jgi:hypothetical protein
MLVPAPQARIVYVDLVATSTKHKVQSTKYKAQSTKHKNDRNRKKVSPDSRAA